MTTSLLSQTRKLMELEASLTNSIEVVQPWLPSQPISAHRVRPLPTTMEQVHAVLSVSRIYAKKTSAPAGWNNGPLVGFSTPNPMPHQLRNGVLAALELAGAEEASRKRKANEERKKEEEKKRKEEPEKKAAKVVKAVAKAPQQRRVSRQPVETQTMNLSDSSSEEESDSD